MKREPWQFQSIQVGAPPKSIKAAGEFGFTAYDGNVVGLGQGVKAIESIATDSTIVQNLSPVGQAAVISGIRAINQIAEGNITAATTTLVGAVIAGTGYYTARAIAEGTVDTVTQSVAEIAGDLGALVPLLGIWIDSMAKYSGSATANTDSEVTAACKIQYTSVRWGTAADGKVLPCDLFMAVEANDKWPGGSYDAKTVYENDGLYLFQGKPAGAPKYHRLSLMTVIDALIDNPGLSSNAKKCWPDQGLTSNERKIAKGLRNAIAAAYQRPGYVRDYMAKFNLPGPYSATAQESDGGYALWPVFSDILWSAWRQGRLQNSFIYYQYAAYAQKGYGNNQVGILADRYAAMLNGIPASKADPTGYYFGIAIDQARTTWMNNSDTGKFVPCGIIEQRPVGNFVSMLTGWDQYVDSHYVAVPKGNAANNPLHGSVPNLPPGIKPGRQIQSTNWLFLAILAGAAGYAYSPVKVKALASTAVREVKKVF